MKKFITLLLLLLFSISFLYGQFTAVMTHTEQGNKKTSMVQSDGTKYRYDLEEEGEKIVVIVDPEVNRTAILMPGKKFVRYMETNSPLSAMNDPYQGFKQMRELFSEKNAGTENMLGFETEKVELYADDKKVYTGWVSPELNFLVKSVNHGNGYTCELINVEQKEVDPAIFSIPEDYTEVDEKMRPVISEPPPPETWNTVKATLPLKGEFKRGDLITFIVPETIAVKITIKNMTVEPAKIITTSTRDRKELPENVQGPVKYRTNRLYKDESLTNTYKWEGGDDKIIKVYEGKLYIEISKEKQ